MPLLPPFGALRTWRVVVATASAQDRPVTPMTSLSYELLTINRAGEQEAKPREGPHFKVIVTPTPATRPQSCIWLRSATS